MAKDEGAEPAALPQPVEDALVSLHAAGELPDEARIAAWCAAHPEDSGRIRKAIESLRDLTPEEHPAHVGPWSILSVLGQGGMGTVYMVERKEPIRMRAALKLIKLGMDSRAVAARFEQEQKTLARMQHDSIAKVYDCGVNDRGRPYFVMELVEGKPLNSFCDQAGLGVAPRLQLMRQVCEAVQHAHHKGVLHRDLKPGNVLVSGDPAAARVKVIDFGLAKALGDDSGGASLFTQAGQVIGTPEYMAPEQADSQNADVDTRADVYSLGVMLYELLVGELPFSRADLRGMRPSGAPATLAERDPPRPSTRLGRIPQLTPSRVQTLRALRSDLDWVVLKALDPDPERRYETPEALSEDLRRFLEHEPLVAGPPSQAYRIRKLVRRYRLQFAAAIAVFLTAMFGAAFALDFAMQAQQQEALANRRADNFNLLSAVVRHERALVRKQSLYPASPADLPRMHEWLSEDCDALVGMRDQIAAALHELAAEDTQTDGEADSKAFLADTLRQLMPKLEALDGTERAEVETMIRWAEFLAESAGRDHPKAPASWAECERAIRLADGVAASERYRGVEVDFGSAAFSGLVPLGKNPVTGLLEFYDLRSAWDGQCDPRTIPVARVEADGSVRVGPETGIVFVLLPGGRTTLGSQKTDPVAPRYEPLPGDVLVLRQVQLDPFLVARHELTRAQWARLWTWDEQGKEPSWFKGTGTAAGKAFQASNPIENVSWHVADQLLRRHSLSLPTLAQWEYACRAGTETQWWPGDQPMDLAGTANIADQTGCGLFPDWGKPAPFDDGYCFHAPVGTFAPNPFGLHDMHGNVREWTLDTWRCKEQERAGDGRRLGPDGGFADLCGGGFSSPPHQARSTATEHFQKEIVSGEIGCRAVRNLRIY